MRGETELKVQPVVYFRKGQHLITSRELELLKAVSDHGSQNKAAAALGISVPVLNKRLKGLEEKAGEKLVDANPLRTRVTPAGKELLEARRRSQGLLGIEEELVIGATPILEDRLRTLIQGDVVLLISNDMHNSALFKAGHLSLLLLDDPDYLMDLTDKEYSGLVKRIVEIGQDSLLHFIRGPEYIRYGYGAQRLGYRFLASKGIEPKVAATTLDVARLFSSGYSFFLNRSLLDIYRERGLVSEDAAGDGEMEEMLMHSLNAVILKRGGTEAPQEIEVLLSELSRMLK